MSIAEVAAQRAQRLLHDAVLGVRLRPEGVLGLRDAEQDQPTDARLDRLGRRLAQRLERVLLHPGHGRHRLRLGDALLDEERQHEVGRVQPRLAPPTAAARQCDAVAADGRWGTP